MTQPLLRTVLMFAAAAPSLAAQAPSVTPDGDPSVLNDTIYSLAVDPADYPDQPFVCLLDDGIVRIDADGRASETYRYVTQVLSRESVDDWGEQSFSYNANRERFTLNWVRVLSPDGTVISEGPTQEHETSASVPEENPVYTDVKVHRVSLGGVAPGTIVDRSYTIERIDPVLPGDFSGAWSVTTGRFTRRSRLMVDVPAEMTPRLDERNLDFERKEYEAEGRRVYVWAAQDIQPVEREPFAGHPDNVYMTLSYAAPIGWDSIASWYASLARDRYALTPDIEDAFGEVVATAETLGDSLRAAHRWVAQDIRYVSLSLGQGGYQPRRPAEVFATKFGDCKDKATLFVALARRMGLEAYPVLVSLGGEVDSTLPSISQFNHMIAALGTRRGLVFLDLTADLVPYPDLPFNLQGGVGLLVRPDGSGEIVVLPQSPPQGNRAEVSIVGELASDGSFRGRYTDLRTGYEQHRMRAMLENSSQLTADEHYRMSLALANRVFEGAEGDSLVLFEGRDLGAEARISILIHAPTITQRMGRHHVLVLPLPYFGKPGLIHDLESRGSRRFPIDVATLNGPSVHRTTFELTLPPDWRVDLPQDATVDGIFGTYRAEYSLAGRRLRVMREMVGASGVQPPDSLPALLRWLRGVEQDDVRLLLLEPPEARSRKDAGR
jgi:transglutaminase-like putative cysteine protease